MTSPLALVMIAFVRAYQRFVSPLLRAAMGPVCRFEPSCSHYAVACLESHGAWRGGLLSLVRVCKCHPFHPGGVDAPPPRPPPRSLAAATVVEPPIQPLAVPLVAPLPQAHQPKAAPPQAAPPSPSP